MTWRIYRLPGSREVWYIDSGCRTQVFNVKEYVSMVGSNSKNVGGEHIPRSWVEIKYAELHIINGVAIFDFPGIDEALRESLLTANMTREGTGKVE